MSLFEIVVLVGLTWAIILTKNNWRAKRITPPSNFFGSGLLRLIGIARRKQHNR